VTRRYIVGAGGHGRVVVELWRAQHPTDELVLLDDDPTRHGQRVLGALVEGPVSLLGRRDGEAVLAIGHNPLRLELGARWRAAGVCFGRAIHPSAVISPSARIGDGTVVFAGVVVNTGAAIGAHVIVNTGVIVEHDCVIEDGASLSPGARMGGRVVVGRGAFLSTGVTIGARGKVGAGSIVGAGAVVLSELPADVLAYGVPARPVRAVTPEDWTRAL
jgi:sugar O-acyltransferase (sialic acid O-acetyltransferase NeuD family)